MTLRSLLTAGIAHLPRGRTLPDDVWRARHRGLCALLLFHVAAIPVFAVAVGESLLHGMVDTLPAALAAGAAVAPISGRLVRSLVVVFGLLSASAMVTHLAGGYIEAHFHFFLVVMALTLYEDWAPFGAAVAFVLLHHGIVGALAPQEVYNHQDALAHPWKWAAIHGAFVAAFCALRIISWRSEERARSESTHAWREVLLRIARAVEFRDDVTGDHVHRMAGRAAQIAAELGLSPAECQAIRDAATLHDAGKVAIADDILRKPAALTPEERRAMERHTEIGHDLLVGSGSAVLDLAAEIALTHHERWDGAGYPHGLRGEEIPLAGRIAAVADVYDALTSDRPYRTAWQPSQAIAMMQRDRGTHFDPQVFDAFLRTLDTGGVYLSVVRDLPRAA